MSVIKTKFWLRDQVEMRAFGTCQYLAGKMGVSAATVRLYFIYISFLTLGSPVLLYFVTAFWVNIRTYLRRGRSLIKS
jgi:phage shock protein PspC (stress-responsive transcriptional regulator)